MAHLSRYAKIRAPRNTVPPYVEPKVSDHELTLHPAMSHACHFCDLIGPGMD
jgi:hypothetical protein